MRVAATSVRSRSSGTVVASGTVTVVAALVSLLSLVVPVRADCSTTAWEPNCNIYLYKLDRSDFLIAFLQFGIPCLICLLLGGWAFWKAQFKFRLLPSVVAASGWSWLSDDRTLEKALGWLTALILAVATLPTVFILLWGIWVYQRISHLLGFAIFFMLMALQMAAYAFAHWKVNGWRLDRLTKFLFALSVALMWTLELWTIYLHEPYTYFNLSVVYVSFNYLPMCLLTFLVARSMTKPVDAYRMLDADPVQDYQMYIKELQAQQKLKVDASDKGPLFSGGVSSASASVSGLVTIHLSAGGKGGSAAGEERKEQVVAVKPANSGSDHVVTIHDGSLGGRASALLSEATGVFKSQIWWRVACYVLALALLLAYSLSVAFIKHADGFGNVVGWVTSGTIIVLDLTVWLCVYGGKINTPLEACIYQGACRIILVMFGDVYWFIGHSVMYVVLAVFFGRNIVNNVLPQLNATAQKSSAVADLLQPASASASAAASGDASPSSSLDATADRYSEQLGAGFMSHGRFSRTRVGQSLLRHIELWAFGILTAAFLADLIVNSATSTVPLELTRSHDQYIVGILAFFLTGIILSSHAIMRMYYNRDYRIDSRLLLACLGQWAVSGGCAGFLWDRTRSVILVTLFCFMPPVLYLSCYAYREWLKADFQLWVESPDPAAAAAQARARADEEVKRNNFINPASPADEEKQQQQLPSPGATPVEPAPVMPGAGSGSAARSFRAPRMQNLQEVNVNLGSYEWLRKYKIVAATVLAAMLVVGMGSCIAANSDPPYVGYSIMAVMLILASTLIPIIEWFNSFEISKNMIAQLVVTTVCFLAFILIFWLEGLERANDNRSLALLFVLFMYPTFVVLAFAVIKWRDDKWVMSLFVKTALVVCCALITTFLIVVAVVYDPWQIGAALLVAFMVILFGSFLIPVLTARFPWLIKWAVGGGLCVLVAFAAGVGSQEGYGFVGFSLAWGILFLCLSVAGWQAHRNASRTAVLSHMCSPGLFPVYGYSTQPGVPNPLHSDNSRVYLVYSSLCVLLVWGLLAIFFVPNTWIGLGVHAIAIVLMLLYAMESTTRPRILLARAVRYLGEMTPQYDEAVNRAKLAAFRAQLSSIKVTSNSPDQQQQHAEAQTVAGSPESSRSAKGAAAGDDSSSSPKPAGGDGKNFLQRTLSMAAEAARSAEPEDLVLDDADLKLLGLDDPAKPLTELDWKGLYSTLVAFRQATPVPSMLAFTKGAAVDVAMVSWRGQQVPRRRAHDLLLRLDHHVALLHTNYLAYQTHVAVELILASEAIKAEHEAELITMLRDTGHAELSAEYLRALKPSDPERVAIEAALVEWKKKQEQLKADRIRKRAEEEERTRQREEEERQRIREEEERVIRARQEQIKADEEAARRKQEELRLRELAEQAEREEQIFRTQQAAKLEAERIEREKQEAERKKQEEALAAQLIAQQNERALQQLREQQEAQRVADEIRREKERQQLQQLAAEQRARDEALAAQQALQAKVATAVRKHCCTLNETGAQFVVQQWYHCITCSPATATGASASNEGLCVVCKDVCHAGHQLRDMGVSSFYCDCGKAGCEAATGVKPGMKGKPTLQSIEAHYAATGQQWVDPDFSPTVSSLLRDPQGKTHPDWKELQWKRPEELRGMKAPVMFHDGADPLDINQGNIGDCWFMSAMSVMTQRQKDFVDIFVSKEHSKAGVYSLNFWKNGERINVLIDSLFPATKAGSAAFGHSAKENELWVMILEKAYAKIHRTYEAIESGFVDQALVDLSGGLGSRIDMTKDPYKQQTRNGVLFKQLLQYRESGFLLGAGSPAGSDSESNASPSGIVQGHAYSILDVQEVDAIQLVRLRNPWGRKEWTGDWSDHSDKWTRRMKAKLGHVEKDDGAFWMSMIDFSIHFEEIYVARFFDEQWISQPIIRGEWAGPTAGGCTNFDSVKDNPQFLLTVTQPNTSVVINLSQTDSRGTSGKLKPIAVEVYSNKGQRVTRTRTGPLVCSNPDSYIYRREVAVDHVFQPGKAPYTVLISTFNQKEETKFAISVYSSAPITFEVAPPVTVAAKK